MLRWQRKNMLRFAFAARLSFFIVLMHAVVLLVFCMYSVSVHDELSVIASGSYLIGADIIVVPFKKNVEQVAAAVMQPVVQKSSSDTTVIKDLQKAEPKQAGPKKAEPEQHALPLKNEVEHKPVPEPVKIPENIEQEIKAVEKPQVNESNTQKDRPMPVKKAVVPPAKKPIASAPVTPQYIGTRQLHTMQIQQAIVEQINRHWQPPAGFDPDIEVILVVRVGTDGNVSEVDTQQSSGVFAYDVHARSAVYEMHFPKACWGKSITIAFK
jgi:outer membrane biosynthesis protein TonB